MEVLLLGLLLLGGIAVQDLQSDVSGLESDLVVRTPRNDLSISGDKIRAVSVHGTANGLEDTSGGQDFRPLRFDHLPDVRLAVETVGQGLGVFAAGGIKSGQGSIGDILWTLSPLLPDQVHEYLLLEGEVVLGLSHWNIL